MENVEGAVILGLGQGETKYGLFHISRYQKMIHSLILFIENTGSLLPFSAFKHMKTRFDYLSVHF